MSNQSGFLSESSFRTESRCGTVMLCGWEGQQGGTAGRNPGEVEEEAPSPGAFFPASHVDERTCMAAPSR